MGNDFMVPQEMIAEIRKILLNARTNVAQQVNNELLSAYWNIGRVIVEYEQDNNARAVYGKDTMKQLSRRLLKEFGKGFSLSNIYNMRQFYIDYPKFQTLSGKLTWSHYCELMSISDSDRRSFYNKELHAYVLIELKTVKLMPEAVGQLNMYLNYYAAEVNEPEDNPPIGIILCTDKDNVSAEYALGGLSNNIFASTYTYVIPEKEKLIAQVEAVLERWKDGKG